MASYDKPVTNWTEAREWLTGDANRIERNIEYIHDVQIPAEEAARIAADQGLQSNITSETQTRQQGDQNLQNQLNTNINQGVKTTDIPSFDGIKVGNMNKTETITPDYGAYVNVPYKGFLNIVIAGGKQATIQLSVGGIWKSFVIGTPASVFSTGSNIRVYGGLYNTTGKATFHIHRIA